VVKEAELAGYGDEAYRAAAVALGAKANLPGGSDFIQPEGIQSIRDYVANVTNVDEFNKLIRDEEFGKAAAFAQSQGFTPDQVATYINENAANLGLSEGFGVTGENIATLYPGYVAPPPPAAVDPVDQQAGGLLNQYYAAIDAGDIRTARNLLSQAQNIYGPETLTNVAQDMLSRLNQSMTQAKTTGDFTGAAKLVEAAGEIYGGDALQNIADYLNTDLQLLDANKGVRFTPQNLVQFIQQGKGDADVPVDAGVSTGGGEAGTPEDEAAVPTAQTTPGPGQIYGLPRFERQAQSNVPFAPLRRGLAQLRPAAFMPGLTSGQAPLGGSGFTPEQLQQASTRITQEGEAAGKTQEQILADFASLMDVGGVSPAELAAATGRAPGELQGYYNQLRPRGLFSTGAPTTLEAYLKTLPFKPVLMERQHQHFLIEMLQQQVALRQDPQE
jgi:hypothetical protein